MQTYQPQNDDFDTVDLFEQSSPSANEERRTAKQEELRQIASKLREMFRKLSDELLLDRERSLALIAEYAGILDDFQSQINALREGSLGKSLDTMAERLEQGVSFLIGFFTAHEPNRRTWLLDRSEIKGNLQKVWPTLREIDRWFAVRNNGAVDLSEERVSKAA